MESLLYFVAWGALLFLMMRFGCGAHVMGHGGERSESQGPGSQMRWVPPKSDFDPVCNRAVRPEKALSSVHDGRVFYFCGAECREAFEATPADFLSPARASFVSDGGAV